MKIDLNPGQTEALAGLLDVAVKAMGIRAMRPEIVGLVSVIQAAVAEEQADHQAVAEAAIQKHQARKARS